MRNRLHHLGRALPVAVAVLAAVTALPVASAAADPAPAPVSRTAAADHPTYIVTVRPDLDPASVAEAYGITPVHVYRDALNGFAARLSPEQVADLRASASVVESVEADGQASGTF
ncbi:protease inhibitor I9 family protein [Streptomyces xanthophaeus]|uniref:protease inhibitor I9 family protein n=1 Tax=Streptomyces xanthophaeus TaxID=67385 RepID=UPI00371450A2